jgi:trk system potassium uptake protein TrkA
MEEIMQIIIVGCGKVGMSIAAQLSQEGHSITVIDDRSDVVHHASNLYDVMGVIGNGASYAIQMDAGIEKADLLIAATDSDEVNLLCCLIAKKAGDCQTIARVRNPVYNNEISFLKEELGLSMVINPEFSAATEIARILRFPSAIKIDTFAKGRVELLKVKTDENSILDGIRLMDLSHRLHCDVLVCAVEREDETIIPKGDFVLKGGDILTIMASPKNAGEFFQKIGIETHQVKNTLIVGGGKIAYYLAEQLITMGIAVKIIEKNQERCEILSELLPRASVIHGDATDRSVLFEEGLAHAESFVSLTDMDEGNILLSLFAKSQSNAKIVTKVNRITFDEVVNGFNLGSIIYPKFITAEYIVQYVRAIQNSIGVNAETKYKIIENKAEALEFWIKEDSPVIGIPLAKLNIKDNVLIACINHKGRIITPRGKDIIQMGDTVIIVTTNTGLNDIKDILKP